jgi:Protein of unknown function (DUF4021)
MNNPHSRKKEKNDNKDKLHQSENTIGLDIDEQVMNGLYGMAETNFEDSIRHGQGN